MEANPSEMGDIPIGMEPISAEIETISSEMGTVSSGIGLIPTEMGIIPQEMNFQTVWPGPVSGQFAPIPVELVSFPGQNVLFSARLPEKRPI